MDEILISRYGEIVESRTDAESILLKRQFKKGEPCIINYRDGGGIGTITAIGIKDGSGKGAHSIVSAGSLIYVQSVVEEGPIDVSITVNGEKYLWKDEHGKWNVVEIEGATKKVTPITSTPRTYIDLNSGNIYVSTESKDVYCLNDLDKRFITKEELEKILEDYQPSGPGSSSGVSAEINTFSEWPSTPDEIPYGESCYQLAPKVTFGDLDELKEKIESGNIELRDVVQFISSIDYIPSDNWLFNSATNINAREILEEIKNTITREPSSGEEAEELLKNLLNTIVEKLDSLDKLHLSLPVINRDVLKRLYFNSESFKNILTELSKIEGIDIDPTWIDKEHDAVEDPHIYALSKVYFPDGLETRDGVINYANIQFVDWALTPFFKNPVGPAYIDNIWNAPEVEVKKFIRDSCILTADGKLVVLDSASLEDCTTIPYVDGNFIDMKLGGSKVYYVDIDSWYEILWQNGPIEVAELESDSTPIQPRVAVPDPEIAEPEEVELRWKYLGIPVKSEDIINYISRPIPTAAMIDEDDYDDTPLATLNVDTVYFGEFSHLLQYRHYYEPTTLMLAVDGEGNNIDFKIDGESFYLYSGGWDEYDRTIWLYIHGRPISEPFRDDYDGSYCDCYEIEIEIPYTDDFLGTDWWGWNQEAIDRVDLLVKLLPAIFKLITGFHADVTKTKFGNDIYKEEIRKIVGVAFQSVTPIIKQLLPPELEDLDLQSLVDIVVDSITGYTLKIELYNCLDITALLRQIAIQSYVGLSSYQNAIDIIGNSLTGIFTDYTTTKMPAPLRDIRGEGNIVEFKLPIQEIYEKIYDSLIDSINGGEEEFPLDLDPKPLLDVIVKLLSNIRLALLSFSTISLTEEDKKQNVILESCDDPARAYIDDSSDLPLNFNNLKRLPTLDEVKELIDSPFIKIIPSRDGVIVYSTKTKGYIYLPYTESMDYYTNIVEIWTSTAASEETAYTLYIESYGGGYGYDYYSSNNSFDESPFFDYGEGEEILEKEPIPYRIQIEERPKDSIYQIRPVYKVDGIIWKLISSVTSIGGLMTGPVDLGLSVFWDSCYLGSYYPYDLGEEFYWGVPVPYSDNVEYPEGLWEKYQKGDNLSLGGFKGVTTYWDEETGKIEVLVDEDGRRIPVKTIKSEEEEETTTEGISQEDAFDFVMDYFNAFENQGPTVVIWYNALNHITKEYISKLLQDAREGSKTCTYKIHLGFGETLIDNGIPYSSTLDDIENSYLIFRFPENTVELNNVEENNFYFEVDQNRTGSSWIPSTFSKPQGWTGEMWMSDQNRGVNSSTDSLYIKTASLMDQVEVTVYIASNSGNECDYDYVVARELDSDTLVKKNSISTNISPSDSISNYIPVKYQIPGDGQEHTIRIDYNKDSISSSGLDRGFLLIKPNLPDK